MVDLIKIPLMLKQFIIFDSEYLTYANVNTISFDTLMLY